MKKRETLIWSNTPGVDEILKSLVFNTQQKNPLLKVDKNFYKNLKPGHGHVLFPCMAIIQEQNEKIKIMSSQIESQKSLVDITQSMIQRMLTEIIEQKKTITILSSQLESIQSSIQKIDESAMKKDRTSLSVPICYDISEDVFTQSSSLSQDVCLQSSSFSSERDLPTFYNSLNSSSLYSQNGEEIFEETSSFYSSCKSSGIDYSNNYSKYQQHDISTGPPLKRMKM